ncbi:MAG: T9SS type A sorting domain-containing protein [Ignavibacterium sp.]|nr:T9SS type A sorting domain-containing protein [Ignavibacterium sp.]MDW8375153.1 T9SS type A sorting domain-containing protein [Ignavibacteriales bacterium]
MIKRITFMMFLLSVVSIFAQNYPHYTIRQLQFVPDSLLAQGNEQSPRVGDTVQVTGVVMVPAVVNPTFDRRPIMWAGARWQTYLRDTNYTSNAWAGINIIQNDTSAAAQGTLMDLIDTAQVVTITGVVAEFGTAGQTGTQTQINVLTNPLRPVQFLGSKPNRGQPVEVTIAQLNNGQAANLLSGEKYEGMYVIIRNVTTSDRNTSTSSSTPFAINDANGNKIFVHDQSGYFTRRTHKLREWEPPLDGTTIQYIRGVIGQFSSSASLPTRYVIRPIYPDDLLIGQSPAAISNVRRNLDVVGRNQAVTITATIVDNDPGGQVVEAKIRYRVNGGNLIDLPMTAGLNNLWSATIPGVNQDSALVDFYIWARDNDGMISLNPVDTLRNKYFYLVLNRPLRIQDVQYSPFGSGFSGYNNYRVTISGVVTADTSDLQGDGNQISRRVHIQNGTGPWSGITVAGLAADALRRGQNVTISGLIRESNNNTVIDSITSIVVNSSNNPLPDFATVSTADIGTLPNGTISAEQWESVLIKYLNVRVTNENADGQPGPHGGGNSNFGEILVADNSNANTRVELQEGNHPYHNLWAANLDSIPGNIRIRLHNTFTELRGILFFSFSNYKLVPRKVDDFVGFSNNVERLDLVADNFSLSQNYPNPFNPITTIEYTIPNDGFVELKVFDILGREVKSLVNMNQSAGNYKVIFDASSLPSGVYIYQINVNNFQATKKMILMK